MISRPAVLAGVVALNVLATPLAVEAQQSEKVYRIGLFHVGLDHVPPALYGLRQGLKELGYEEGKNLRWDFRNLPDETAAQATAREFVRQRVDVMVAFEEQTVRAARAATSDIPILFLHVLSDPVAEGFAQSLAHPGGNTTGIFGDVLAKRVELLKEVMPRLERLLLVFDPADPVSLQELATVRAAAHGLQVQVVERAARTAADRRLAVPGHRKEWAEQGALFSYGADYFSVGRIDAARLVDRMLKGTKPAALPVERIARLELVINLRTAKALGLTIPQSLLLRVDKVIE